MKIKDYHRLVSGDKLRRVNGELAEVCAVFHVACYGHKRVTEVLLAEGTIIGEKDCRYWDKIANEQYYIQMSGYEQASFPFFMDDDL